MYFLFAFFFLLVLIFVIVFHFRKKKILQKLCSMSQEEKCCLLNELTEPLGYLYDCCQNVFTTRVDAWQKEFGFTYAYDRFAPFFNMVFDAQPIYFDYNGRTWLIEVWKGQYGITTGGEVGIYRADGLAAKKDLKKTLFHAVTEEDMLTFSLTLTRRDKLLAGFTQHHWWLTAFCMGMFSSPSDLCMEICMTFPNCEMLSVFVRALLNLGWHAPDLSVSGNRLCFPFVQPYTGHFGVLCRLNRGFALWRDKCLCRLYNFVVRPLVITSDQLLYLYFYLPFVFRRIFRLHIGNRKCRKKYRQTWGSRRPGNLQSPAA